MLISDKNKHLKKQSGKDVWSPKSEFTEWHQEKRTWQQRNERQPKRKSKQKRQQTNEKSKQMTRTKKDIKGKAI